MEAHEYADLDATALAALVRDGQVSAEEVQKAATAALDAVDPQLNALVGERFAAPLEYAADGPFAGVPFAIKDLILHATGVAQTAGSRMLGAGVPMPADTHLMARFRRAGLATLGVTATPELGFNADDRAGRHRPGAQPLGHRPEPRRVVRRLGGARRRAGRAGRPRQRRGRLDPHPGGRVRAGRAQAQPGTHLARAGLRGPAAGHGHRVRPDPHGARLRRAARRGARRRARRPLPAARPRSALPRRGRGGQPPAAGGRADHAVLGVRRGRSPLRRGHGGGGAGAGGPGPRRRRRRPVAGRRRVRRRQPRRLDELPRRRRRRARRGPRRHPGAGRPRGGDAGVRRVRARAAGVGPVRRGPRLQRDPAGRRGVPPGLRRRPHADDERPEHAPRVPRPERRLARRPRVVRPHLLDGGLHRAVQRHRQPGDLAAARAHRGGLAGRRAGDGALRRRVDAARAGRRPGAARCPGPGTARRRPSRPGGPRSPSAASPARRRPACRGRGRAGGSRASRRRGR